MTWTRRDFLKYGAVVPLLAGLGGRMFSEPAAPVLAVLAHGKPDPFDLGARLGIEEAQRTADLLRRPLELLSFDARARGADELVRALEGAGAAAVVSGLPQERQAQLERAASEAGILVIDARAVRRDAMGARPGVFRTGAPARAYRAALTGHLGSKGPVTGYEAALWMPGLFRYGAEQLNTRYRRRFGEGMTGDAWAAWMAVKILAETALRAQSPSEIEEALARGAFDGHKGAPLVFSPSGQLIQPLYIVGPEETVQVEWPLGEEEG